MPLILELTVFKELTKIAINWFPSLNDSLFGDGLGLDSIDALELIVLLDKDYGIKLVDPKEGKNIFQSIETMATYISANRTK